MATETKTKQSVRSGIPVYDIAGKEVKSMELPKEIFNAPVNNSLIAQAVRVYLSNQRGGNASTKTRSEVIGSTKKIYRQKGTGRARHGANKAPIFVGGGIAGGPKPKDHTLQLNKAMKQQALFGALTNKAKAKEVVALVEDGLEKTNKTKAAFEFLKKVGFAGKKITVVFPKMEKGVFVKAIRNIEGLEMTDAMSLNTYGVLRSKYIIFLESAVEALEKHYK
jgi:large subunit ribosomal protein L4